MSKVNDTFNKHLGQHSELIIIIANCISILQSWIFFLPAQMLFGEIHLKYFPELQVTLHRFYMFSHSFPTLILWKKLPPVHTHSNMDIGEAGASAAHPQVGCSLDLLNSFLPWNFTHSSESLLCQLSFQSKGKKTPKTKIIKNNITHASNWQQCRPDHPYLQL